MSRRSRLCLFESCEGCERTKPVDRLVLCSWVSDDNRTLPGGKLCTECWEAMPPALIVSQENVWTLVARTL